jgi:outer membrane protease
MQKKIKLLIVMLSITTGLYAQSSQFTTSVSLVGMSMDYKEYDDGGTLLDSEKSGFTDIAGVEMNIGYLFDKEASAYNQVGINFMVLHGTTDYKGSLWNSGLGYGSHVDTTLNTIIDMDISYKRGYKVLNSLELNYGLGLGYRYWERSLSASQIETYTWYSLRPMVGAKYFVNDELNIGLSLEYQYGINPTMHESTFDYDFKLGHADIIEVSLPITYKYNERMDMFIEATFQQQIIEKSNTIQRAIGVDTYDIFEPDSTANNQYLKLGMAFKF